MTKKLNKTNIEADIIQSAMVSLKMSLPSIDQNGILVLIHGNDYACSSIDIISESDVPVSEKTKTENKNCNQIKSRQL